MIHKFSLLSDYAMVDQAGKLSVLGIFNRLFAKDFPVTHAKMFFVCAFEELGEGEHKFELHVSDPVKKKVMEITMPMKVKEAGKGQVICELVSVAFERAGQYVFTSVVDGKQLGKTELTVETTK